MLIGGAIGGLTAIVIVLTRLFKNLKKLLEAMTDFVDALENFQRRVRRFRANQRRVRRFSHPTAILDSPVRRFVAGLFTIEVVTLLISSMS
jgi:hypothetical protein